MNSFFDVASEKLEELTLMNRIQCRGTIRIICKEHGYDKPDKLKRKEMIALLEMQLAKELEKRLVDDFNGVTEAVIEKVKAAPEIDRAYDVFSRI